MTQRPEAAPYDREGAVQQVKPSSRAAIRSPSSAAPQYSHRLNPMVEAVRVHLLDIGANDTSSVREALANFCFGYPAEFLEAISTQVGFNFGSPLDPTPASTLPEAFLAKLTSLPGECVFLLRDAFEAMAAYQDAKRIGFGILANRQFICADEDQYFELLRIIYVAAEGRATYDEFLERYFFEFSQIIQRNSALFARAKYIANYVEARAADRKITFVDIGFQATFCLFSQACIRYFFPGKTQCDIYLFATYPWLEKLFHGRFFTSDVSRVIGLERRGRNAFRRSLARRASGAMSGFAVGDALGFPLAGVSDEHAGEYVAGGRITGFAASPRHPHFSGLHAGQYTSNTMLMRTMAELLVERDGYDREDLIAALKEFGSAGLDPRPSRWIGPTNRRAIEHFLTGATNDAPMASASCAGAYRAIPLGLFYRPMLGPLGLERDSAVQSGTRLTHNSDVSVAGALIVASIVGDLVQGVSPRAAVLGALKNTPHSWQASSLFAKLSMVLEWGEDVSAQTARATLGTGSPTDQTLPMAVFLLLSNELDFRQTVLAGANSLRSDNRLEQIRLAHMPVAKAMIAATGGNTDGIAALSGAFAGARLGKSSVPKDFRQVEDCVTLETLGRLLVRERH